MVKRKRKKSVQRIMPFPLRLPPPLRAKLEALAAKDRRSLSSYLLVTLEDHAADKERLAVPK